MTTHSGEPPIYATDFLPESRNISNSEVQAFLSCKRMYDFSFIMGIEPKEQAPHLNRGTIGHGCFETYIKARLNGDAHDTAMKAVKPYLAQQLREKPNSIEVISEAQFLFERYQSYHHGWPEWELLSTEERVDLKLTDDFNIAIRYDLMVKEKATGRILIGDWKFTYDFWRSDDHAINPQMPKYLAVMRANGYQVDGGFLKEIRTRKLGKELASNPDNLWKKTPYLPIQPQMHSMMKQHIIASKQIQDHRALDETYRTEYVSIPVLNKYGPCKYCPFLQLCDSMNKGKTNLSTDIEASYQPTTYGYNKTESVVEEVGF